MKCHSCNHDSEAGIDKPGDSNSCLLGAFRSTEIRVSFKMVLKYREKEISSQEDNRNLTAKDLREILRYHLMSFRRFLHCFRN